MAREDHQYVYGMHPVSESLKRRPKTVHRVYVAGKTGVPGRFGQLLELAESHGVQVVQVSRRDLEDLVGAVVHQGVVAAVESFRYRTVRELLHAASSRQEAPLLVALDQVQDPHNVGAIVRSALAFGAHGVIVTKDRSVGVTPTVVKVSAGATAELGIAQVTNLRRTLDELKTQGLWVVGAAASQQQTIMDVDLSSAVVLVIGSEGRGLRRLVQDSCDHLVAIPMLGGMESLNASVAAGVTLYEAARQRMLSAEEG